MTSRINFLHLINFRNHADFQLSSDAQLIIIEGANGAGKTSILEAISLFAPGKGLRNAKVDEMLRYEQCGVEKSDNKKQYSQSAEWGVYSLYNIHTNNISLSTGCNFNKNTKRILKIDDKIIKKQSDILECIRIVWLTPQMERVLFDTASFRRKLWDRICYNLYPEHAANFIAYEYYVKSRMKILYMPYFDNLWLDNLERQIAEFGMRIIETRIKCLEVFSPLLESIPFIKNISPEFSISDLADYNLHQKYFIDHFISNLKKYREIDKKSNRTNFGPHKTDIIIHSKSKNLNIKYCSTGEQKLILSAMTLAHAQSIFQINGISPIILLDEVFAHLDPTKQEIVLNELSKIKSQVFLTTTNKQSLSISCDPLSLECITLN